MRYANPAWEVDDTLPSSAAFHEEVRRISASAHQPERDRGDALGALTMLADRGLLVIACLCSAVIGACITVLLT